VIEDFLKLAMTQNLRVHFSLTPTLSQFALAANGTFRQLITDPTSPAQLLVREYVEKVVKLHYQNPIILSWGMGNELNLDADGCTYAGLPGQVRLV
jgi:hypothetical protein